MIVRELEGVVATKRWLFSLSLPGSLIKRPNLPSAEDDLFPLLTLPLRRPVYDAGLRLVTVGAAGFTTTELSRGGMAQRAATENRRKEQQTSSHSTRPGLERRRPWS